MWFLNYWLILLVKGSSRVCGSSSSSQIALSTSTNLKLGICERCELILQAAPLTKVGNQDRQAQVPVCPRGFWFAITNLIFLNNSSLSSCVHLTLASPTSCLPFLPNWVTTDYLTVSVSQELGSCLSGSSGPWPLTQDFGQVSSFIWRPTCWRIEAPTCGCWQDLAYRVLWDRGPQFLTGCQPEGPSDICRMGLSIEKSHDGKWLPSEQANERLREGK